MTSRKKTARMAGLLYLLSSIPGFFCLIYIPSHFLVSRDAGATARKILASEFVFRLGIVSEIAAFTGFIFVVWALFRLFAGVDRSLASLLALLLLISIPVSLLNVLNPIAALTLVRGADFLSAFDLPQREALAMLFLKLHFAGFMIAQVFWGLWLVPFGLLVYRSGFLPRVLGVLLIVACFGYLTNSLVEFGVLPANGFFRGAGRLTALELPIIFWLLIRGAKEQPAAVPAGAVAGAP